MFLLDTNVVSELRQGKPRQSPAVRAWAASMPAQRLYLSAISVMELEMGVQRMERKDAQQGAALRTWLAAILNQFDGRVLPFDTEAALLCAAMHVPDTRSFRDAMIAATARQHRLTVVTRNVRDFEGLGVELVNPWGA